MELCMHMCSTCVRVCAPKDSFLQALNFYRLVCWQATNSNWKQKQTGEKWVSFYCLYKLSYLRKLLINPLFKRRDFRHQQWKLWMTTRNDSLKNALRKHHLLYWHHISTWPHRPSHSHKSDCIDSTVSCENNIFFFLLRWSVEFMFPPVWLKS